jgi:acyl-CoA synthetase (AMP-forming)/AMP-acid ligase II/pimeloyl-ACP methyl ester carboxylesterase
VTSLPDAATWRAWGIDPEWSRLLDVVDRDGVVHRWHVLDTGAGSGSTPAATVVCVHGNPTWAYAWKSFMAAFADRYRVVAIDQLGMGFSERTELRRYRTRVADLADVIDALDVDRSNPLVLAAHDWGGAIAMGWAVDHADDLAGLVLCNTGIGVPAGRTAPKLIRLAAAAPLRDLVCRRTPTFVEGTVRLSGRRISKLDRAAFRAPYRRATNRRAIADFVGDVPLSSPHPSEGDLADVAGRLDSVTAPVLLAWGTNDPVFGSDFAADLAGRLPNASVQRFPGANHLVMAEADVAATVDLWLSDLVGTSAPGASRTAHDSAPFVPVWSAIERRRDDDAIAVHDDAGATSRSFRQLASTVDDIARDLRRRGLRPGDRVAMLTPPGVDLIAAVYGVWRAGGVTVVADRGLGLAGLGRAVRSASVSWVIGPREARLAATVLRWAPRAERIDIAELGVAGQHDELPDPPGPDALAAVLFTSGATGPAKGVRYTHRQFAAQRDALAATYDIVADDRLVAAFAPFALYGPALGITSVLPDCDVTKPGELTAAALEHACAAVDATMVFASPAALTNVLATSGDEALPALGRVRLVQSAGAPVPSETLRAMSQLAPQATLHTPYGMTEALPVADVDLRAIDVAEREHPGAGVCVGRPVDGAEVLIAPLGFDAGVGVPTALGRGITGEVLVRAPWVSDGYLDLWETERRARPGDGWHRSGDVGHVDDDGLLWIEGRSVHVIDGDRGPITSVPIERAVERADIAGVTPGRVAAVGVGPSGTQQLVVVIESATSDVGLAPSSLADAVRGAVDLPVAAVLVTDALPVDIRHNAKIDRAAVASWASGILAGTATPRRRRVRHWLRR